MDKYFPLFSLQTEHNYLGNSREPVLRFIPTENTQKLLQNAGAIFRATSDGFEIIVNELGCEIFAMFCAENEATTADIEVGDAEVDQPPNLVFKGFAIEPHFAQFTQSNVKSGIDCFFVSNSSLLQQSGRLHTSDFLDDSSVISLKDSPYKHTLSSDERINTPTLIVSISLKQMMPVNDLLQQAKTPYRYSVAFENRKNIWKYLILGGEKFNNLQVIDLDNNFEFGYYGKENLGSNEFLVFLSTIPIPFHKQFIRRFQLQDTEPPYNHIVVEQLPAARISQGLARNPEQDGAFVTEIFVNL